MNIDQKYMQRCLELAHNGLGNTYTNPMVGSVIVYDNKIIGEGFHHKAGQPHAEVNAINSVKDKDLLKNSTLYVNLEPCSHYGKTPPCSLLIIQMQIPRVVIGCTDSFSEVSGRGIKMLMEAGVDVKVGVLEKESRELNKRFFVFHEKKRPYIILKWAETRDGFIDLDREEADHGQPTWITNDIARVLVHKWRREEQAILVGTNTAIKDNPSLNVRDWSGNDPMRILIDRELKVPETHSLFNGQIETHIFTQMRRENRENVFYHLADFDTNLEEQILDVLYGLNIQSLIIEGGRIVLQNFLDKGLWDEVRRFVGDTFFVKGVLAPECKESPSHEDSIGNSSLYIYRNAKNL